MSKDKGSAAAAASNVNRILNFEVLCEDAREEFESLLSKLPSSSSSSQRTLVLDPSLVKSNILPPSYLKTKKIEVVQELVKKNIPTSSSSKASYIFIVRPTIPNMRLMQKWLAKASSSSYVIGTVGNVESIACESYLANSGSLQLETHTMAGWEFLYWEQDILSLEMKECFKESALHKDNTCLLAVKSSIEKLNVLFGGIPEVKVVGPRAAAVHSMLKAGGSNSVSRGGDNEIDSLILIDRSVDLISVLSTPMTYESLLDELFSIQTCTGRNTIENVPFVDDDDEADNGGEVKKTVELNDALFLRTRNMDQQALGLTVQNFAKDVRERRAYWDEGKEQRGIEDINIFVKTIPELKKDTESLKTHINLMEILKEKVSDSKIFRSLWDLERSMISSTSSSDSASCVEKLEEAIDNQQMSLMSILRLVCLLSLTSAMKNKAYDGLRKALITSYGYEVLLTLNNLEKAGLIKREASASSTSASDTNIGKGVFEIFSTTITGGGGGSFSKVVKALRLLTDGVSGDDDISYVSSGYAPLSCRLVELMLDTNDIGASSSMAVQEALSLLPGPIKTVMEPQKVSLNHHQSHKKVVVVYFIGGVTWMEIAALRRIATRDDNLEIIVATTGIINGNSLLQTLIDKEMVGSFRDKL